MLDALTLAYLWVVQFESRVLVEPELAELALPALGVVEAVLADASAHVARRSVYVRVEEAGVGVVVAVAF